jgi:cyanophycinase-like exopeptidase
MSGLIALVGGNEFRPYCEPMDRALLAKIVGKPKVVIVPTAAAQENPALAAKNGVRYFKRLGARAEAAMVVDSATGRETKWVTLIQSADLVYFTGGNPVYLLKTMRNAPAWKAALEVWKSGRMLAGSSAGAMICGGKMWAPGEGWCEGLGLLPGIAVIPHHARLAALWNAEQMRVSLPKEVILVGIDEATVLLGPPWQVIGPGKVALYKSANPEFFTAGQPVDLRAS